MSGVLLKFCAEWCGACKRVGSHGADLIDVDKEENAELCSQFDIDELPTFVHIKDGVVSKLIHPETDKEIEEWMSKIS